MANFNLMELFKSLNADVNHSKFDLSKNIAFSLPCSYLRPVYSAPTMPNEHHKIDFSGIMRTETMNTAAFVRGKVHVNFFFVPYSQCWHPFNQFVSQKRDKHSTRFLDSKFVPNISLYHIVNDHLRRLAVLPKYDANGESQNYDQFHFNRFFGACALLQVLGYGNWYWMFGLSDSELESHIQDFFGEFTSTGWKLTKDKYVNLFPILSYQHIWYDYYRNSIYDDYEYDGGQYVLNFNLDQIECSTVANSHVTLTVHQFAHLFACRNIQYKKDLFTSLMPSTQFGAVSSVEFDTLDFSNLSSDKLVMANADGSLYATDDLSFINTADGGVNEGQSLYLQTHGLDSQDFLSDGKSSFDVLSLRRAQLLQRWKQNALRAGNMVDDNFESHYGVKPYYEDDNVVRFLGSFSADLNVNPVTATATTDNVVNGKVGDLAAIGVGSFSGQEIDFQCKDFGTIIGVAAFLPDVGYNANGIQRENTLIEPFDYPAPEFNNVGFEPLDVSNMSLEFTRGLSNNNFVMGFASPWSYMKTNVDEQYDEFSSFKFSNSNRWTGSLTSWVFKRYPDLVNTPGGVWMLKRTLYVHPNTTDSVFGINYDGSNATNPFLFNCTVNHRAIRPLSVLGLPEF